MRLAIVIAGLAGGGAERVASRLAGELTRLGHAVSLVTFHGHEPEFYEVDPGVARIRLDAGAEGAGAFGRVGAEATLLRRLRRALVRHRTDAVIAFATETSVRTIVATLGTGIRVVAAERTDPARHDPGTLWRAMRRHLYRFAHAVVVQTADAAAWIAGGTGAGRVAVIPNSIATAEGPGGGTALRIPRPCIAGLGRFRPEKGFDQLIAAFGLLHAAHPDWHVVLAGEGPEEARLRDAAARHGLEGRVHFVGPVTDTAGFLAQADIFALPSRYEGFPNALLEAMACGVPAVSFDSQGARAIVRDRVDGLLVPSGDVPAYAKALGALMDDAVERSRLGRAACEVRDRFAPDRVVAQWLAVLE